MACSCTCRRLLPGFVFCVLSCGQSRAIAAGPLLGFRGTLWFHGSAACCHRCMCGVCAVRRPCYCFFFFWCAPCVGYEPDLGGLCVSVSDVSLSLSLTLSLSLSLSLPGAHDLANAALHSHTLTLPLLRKCGVGSQQRTRAPMRSSCQSPPLRAVLVVHDRWLAPFPFCNLCND